MNIGAIFIFINPASLNVDGHARKFSPLRDASFSVAIS
jgi:hypothetical protein